MCVQTDSMRTIRVSNSIMFDKYDSYKAQQSRTKIEQKKATTTLNRDAAIERAKKYLKVFHWEVPTDFKLSKVEFDKWFISRWQVTWKRFSGQYEWDELSARAQCVSVVFHEVDGLDAIFRESCFPPPKQTQVRLTKDQAISKAAPYVEIAQHTAAVSGYVATKVKSCVLRVAAPEYKLRLPEKELYPEIGVPKETRLCWVVTFYIENPKTKNDAYQIILPGIPVIYIDAATGDVFGFACEVPQ